MAAPKHAVQPFRPHGLSAEAGAQHLESADGLPLDGVSAIRRAANDAGNDDEHKGDERAGDPQDRTYPSPPAKTGGNSILATAAPGRSAGPIWFDIDHFLTLVFPCGSPADVLGPTQRSAMPTSSINGYPLFTATGIPLRRMLIELHRTFKCGTPDPSERTRYCYLQT